MEKYDPNKIESKWQKLWEKQKLNSPDLDKAGRPFYNLMMFPYPSAEGLHVGNMYAFVHSDAYGRFMRLKGFDVFEPIGLDGFGIHSENYAIKQGEHILDVSKRTEKHFYEQLHMIGNQYDWTHTLETYKPDYYKWTQWIFVQMFKKGLAYQAESYVNWCPSCKTVLSDEQVISGRCERCNTLVAKKMMKQWFFKITDYAERLLKNLDWINWSERTKIAQRNWIGKSEGAEIKFKVQSFPASPDPSADGRGRAKFKDTDQNLKSLEPKYNEILLATNNLSKKERVEKLLSSAGLKIKILLPKDIELKELSVKEDNDLFKNAKEKAELYRDKTNLPILGLDTGFFIQGEKNDSVRVKRNASGNKQEEDLSQEEIAEHLLDYYKNIATKNGGEVEVYWQDVTVLSLPDGKVETVEDKREVILTDKVKGKVDIYFPVRSLYKTKITGKYTVDENEEEHLLGLKPFTDSLIKLLANQSDSNSFEVFTTRLDTIFGCTYCVLAPEHKLIQELKPQIENWGEVEKYIAKAQKKSELERTELAKDKTGVELEGIKAINPFNNEAIPIFVADYVLGHYGTGAVMAVPAHDERDYEFAKKYDLSILQSVTPDTHVYKRSIMALEVLSQIYEAAKKQDVKFWLMGGLACAFYARIVYREFEDLDLITKDEDSYHKILKIFDALGFEKVREKKLSENLTNSVYKNKEGVEIDIGPYIREFGFQESDFEEEEKTLNQYRALVVSKRFLKSFKKMQLESRNKEKDRIDWEYLNGKVFVDDGVLVNSGEYNELNSEQAREKMGQWLEKNNLGGKEIHYKLRDWCVSRQRYWGPPIPMIYCEKCGVIPVPENDLPVLLPKTKDYLPRPDGLAPLARNEKFVKTKCPKCGGQARRETDVSDTFLDSAWYFFRYPSTEFDDRPLDKLRAEKWFPVDMYIGGQEHAVLHLLYSRFMTMFFKDLGLIDFEEPYKRFFAHGLLIREGAKISKSKGNVVNPDEYIKKYGADAVRIYLMFLGDVRQGGDWRDAGMNGMYRFANRIWKLSFKVKASTSSANNYSLSEGEARVEGSKIKNLLHKTIKKVGEDLENLKFNTAISALMILVNRFEEEKEISIIHYSKFLILLAPFAPHITEELWSQLGNKESIFVEKWPEYDKNLVKDETIELVIQINGKVRDKIRASADISESDAKFAALSSEKVKSFLAGKKPKKVIFVKGRLVNIVV